MSVYWRTQIVLALFLASLAGCVTGKTAAPAFDARGALPRPAAEEGLCWYAGMAFPVEGQGWTDVERRYDRLPARAKAMVRPQLWDLSRNSAGLCVRFVTDASEISLHWRLTDARLAMEHMPATGVSGIDLYARDGEDWRWAGLARPPQPGENRQRLIKNIPAGPREYKVYLPLYNGIESFDIGVNAAANVWQAPSDAESRRKPVVFYGTSITHGGCASRPGMSYPAILGRRLHRPTINLGFSSNGTMDPELGALMSEVDAAAYVVDCLPNMGKEGVEQRTAPLVRRLRQAHPETPIVLVEGVELRNSWLLTKNRETMDAMNAALRAAYEQLRADGVRHLYYVTNKHLLGGSSDTAVDGIHPNDWGFECYADALMPALRKALKESHDGLRP